MPLFANALIADLLALTTDIIGNPNYYNVSKADIPGVVSNLNFYTQPAQIICLFLAGFTYDIMGRKVTILVCFVISGIAGFFTPYASPNVYPWLFVIKVLYTMSIAPVFANPLVNDYVGLKTRARGISFVHVGMNIGHFF